MRYVLVFLLLGSSSAFSQSANTLNFNYLYNAQGEVTLQTMPVHHGDSIEVYYRIVPVRETTVLLAWEKRESMSQRVGVSFGSDTVRLSGFSVEGKLRFAKPDKPFLLVASVTNTDTRKKYTFVRQIEAHYPVNGYLRSGGHLVWNRYITTSDEVSVHGSGNGKMLHFAYYTTEFPTPIPPFSNTDIKSDPLLVPDSVFSIQPGSSMKFTKPGLYLSQEDTTSSFGFSFLVRRPPYPRYNMLADLKGPLLFVTTPEENASISKAGEDKAAFDKVILGITKDTERAKNFMRNYFKRVELANNYFGTFKDGWKTDRGMVFIVFGTPDIVLAENLREIWQYKNLGIQFVFVRTGSVYGPDHYVLVRNKDYAEYWYQTVDMVRKSRF